MKQLTKKSMIYTITGIIFALIIFYLTFTGNPKNMGVCVGCFIRDTSGAVNLHNAKASGKIIFYLYFLLYSHYKSF